MFNEAYITTIRFGLRVWFKSGCFIILFSWISILLTSKNLHCSRTNQIYKLNFAYPCIFSKCSIAIYSFQWYFFLFILICIEVQLNCLNYVHALYLPMYRTNRGFPMHFHIVFPPFHLSNPLTMVYLYLSTLPGLAIHLSNACKLYSILTSALPFSVSILLFPYFFKIYGKFLST